MKSDRVAVKSRAQEPDVAGLRAPYSDAAKTFAAYAEHREVGAVARAGSPVSNRRVDHRVGYVVFVLDGEGVTEASRRSRWCAVARPGEPTYEGDREHGE